jgi:hypothetical protein
MFLTRHPYIVLAFEPDVAHSLCRPYIGDFSAYVKTSSGHVEIVFGVSSLHLGRK